MRYRDAHTHLAAGACDLADLDLRRAASPASVVEAVAAACSRRAPGRWVRGWGWDGRAGESGALDRAAPDHPVFVARRDGHAGWINGPARAELGVETEIVVEGAFDDARRRLPALADAERDEAVARMVLAFSEAGIVALDDFVEPWGPEVYARLDARGALPLAVDLWLPEAIAAADARSLRAAFPRGRGRVAVAGIKIFLDGTLGARTAALSAPYADDARTRGTLRLGERELADRVRAWAGDGWPVAVHAIGDLAVGVALDVLSEAPRAASGPHRIEHAQVVRVADLPRFRASGIVASVQPLHHDDDRAWSAARLGTREGCVLYPLASLARAGATLLFGSDWPVSSFAPEAILDAATAPRRGDEALDPASAIACASA